MTTHPGDTPESRTYNRWKTRLFFATLLLDVVLLTAFQASGLSIGLRAWTQRMTSNPWAVSGLYFTVFAAGMFLIHFPLDWFKGFVWEHRFGLSVQTFGRWLADEAKQAALSFAILLIMVVVIYALLRVLPSGWWIAAAGFWLLVTLVLARLMPDVIIPLFYRYKPVADEELRRRIHELFERCGVGLEGVYVIDFSAKTKKANAFVCGLGSRRRVVLSDTLTEQFTIPEIETVVAHELGHHRHRDIVKLIAVHTAVVLFGFFLADRLLRLILPAVGVAALSDVAGLPAFVLIMMLFGFVMTPLLNVFSRRLERQADAFSLRMTSVADFVSVMNKLGAMNLAEFRPSRLDEMMFYDHPTLEKRIRFAESFQADNAL